MTLLMILALGPFTSPSLVPRAKFKGAKASSGVPGRGFGPWRLFPVPPIGRNSFRRLTGGLPRPRRSAAVAESTAKDNKQLTVPRKNLFVKGFSSLVREAGREIW